MLVAYAISNGAPAFPPRVSSNLSNCRYPSRVLRLVVLLISKLCEVFDGPIRDVDVEAPVRALQHVISPSPGRPSVS